MATILDSSANALERVFGPTSRFFMKISLFFLALMPIPIFINVILRWLFDTSIPGIPEIVEFMMVIVIYFIFAYINQREGQMSIDIVYVKLPKWLKAILNTLAAFLCTVFFVLVCYQLFWRGIEKIHDNEVSWALNIPIFIFLWIASLGSLVMTGVSLIAFLRSLSESLENRHLAWLVIFLGAACLMIIAPYAGWISMDVNPVAFGGIGMGVLFLLLFLKVPIGIGMGIVGVLGMIVMYGSIDAAMGNLAIAAYSNVANDIIAVAPMFVLMGQLVYHSGISQDIFKTATTWLGRLRGGLAMASIAGCAGFSAVCGDSLATSVTMATIAVPEMKKKKYSMKLATACPAAAGTLGILIPPSLGFIFYAIVTEESIGRLFIAGMIPGLLLAVLFMITIFVMATINPEIAPQGEKTSIKEKIISLKGIFWMLALFVIILGGILAGIFSPTEGGAIGAVGSFVFAVIRRRLTWEIFVNSLVDTISITSRLLLILIGVGALGYFLAITEIPFALAEFITGLGFNRYVIFAMVIVLFIFMGCVMNVIPILLLVLPTIAPAIEALGFDMIWFGVVTVITMEIGQITPPIGVIVFAIGSVVKEVPVQEIFKGIIPFFICMVVCIILLTIFPQLALWLPGVFFN